MAPYLHQFSAAVQEMQYVCCKFSITIRKIYAGIASSKGAIW